MRELPEFRGHCGRAFTQYEQIRHIRGNLKLMTEATCSEWLIGGARHCARGQSSYGERQLMLPWIAMKGRIFHPNCDGWRSVHVAVIRDKLEEDPCEASSSDGRRYNFRQ